VKQLELSSACWAVELGGQGGTLYDKSSHTALMFIGDSRLLRWLTIPAYLARDPGPLARVVWRDVRVGGALVAVGSAEAEKLSDEVSMLLVSYLGRYLG
jgi:hypothetical protein